MKNYNRKGFGLVMAIMTITVLLIMAAGFFHVTNYSTKAVQRNIESLRLYWAVESASNFNVNWWVNQDDNVRISWPSTYSAPVSKQTYMDLNTYKYDESMFPRGNGTTTNGAYYLHASSVVEKDNNPVIDGYEIITVRYKGERFGEPGEAVWVLDSYARDTATGNYSNITMTNVYNRTYEAVNDWLINSEAIVFSIAGTGFNGALGAFHQKDVRYGPCYYADIIRLDCQTGGSLGARFYKGPVKSSALDSGSILAQSRWGAVLDGTKDLIDPGHVYGYGLALRENWATEAEATAKISTMFTDQIDGSLTPYYKNEAALPTEDILWTWRDIADDGEEYGIFLLDSINGSGNVTITLSYDAGANDTFCNITYDGATKSVPLGDGGYKGVAVPSNYGQVSISGISNKNFTLVTETDQVNITNNLYVHGMEGILSQVQALNAASPLDLEQMNTSEVMLEKIWSSLTTNTSETKLSIISQLNDKKAREGDPFYLMPRRPGLLFSTVAYATWNGMYNMPANYGNSPDMKFINVGSAVTFNRQEAYTGDPSGAWTKTLIQDQRYEDPSFGTPDFWGPGPSALEEYELSGLNRNHTWTKSVTDHTDNLNYVAWPTGSVPSF